MVANRIIRMDLLQSFMGCMYPGSIRTESIESIEHDYPDFRFEVINVDERGNQVSEGELHLTDRDLIYFRPSKSPTRWPLNSLRRYGSDRNSIFIFEAGRSSPMEGIYAFRLIKTVDLNRLSNRVKEMLQKLSANEQTTIQHDQIDDILSSHYVPQKDHGHSPGVKQRKKDASTSTENQTVDINHPDSNRTTNEAQSGADPRPLSYVLIDFDTTKALNDSAQAHAASRQSQKF